MNELSSVFREDDPMGLRDGFQLPEFPTADDAGKAVDNLSQGSKEALVSMNDILTQRALKKQ